MIKSKRNFQLPSVVELFLLLGNSSINLSLDLSKLKLGSENLVLLSLKSSLSLLKSSLELLLLCLNGQNKIYEDEI